MAHACQDYVEQFREMDMEGWSEWANLNKYGEPKERLIARLNRYGEVHDDWP